MLVNNMDVFECAGVEKIAGNGILNLEEKINSTENSNELIENKIAKQIAEIIYNLWQKQMKSNITV